MNNIYTLDQFIDKPGEMPDSPSVRRIAASYPHCGVAPRERFDRFTSPRYLTYETLGSHESRALQVTGRRAPSSLWLAAQRFTLPQQQPQGEWQRALPAPRAQNSRSGS